MDPEVKLEEFDYCHVHHKECRRVPGMGPDLDLVVAGSPCPDHSNFGKHNGQAGESGPAFMTLTLCSQLFQDSLQSIQIMLCLLCALI